MRTVISLVAVLFGAVLALYGSVGALFVSGAVGRAGEDAGWGTVLALLLVAAFGVLLVVLGIRRLLGAKS